MPRSRRLWRTYALAIAALVTLVLIVSGLAQLWLIEREVRAAVLARQALEATRASARIDRFIGDVDALLRSCLSLLDSGHIEIADDSIRLELYRLMKQSNAIQELYWIDPLGRERVRVSRLASDQIGQHEGLRAVSEFLQARGSAPWFGPVEFVVNQPRVVMARRGRNPESGVLAAQVDLAQLRDIIGETSFDREGYAYVVDQEGRLLAYPDFNHILSRTDWSERPPVRAAISLAAAGGVASEDHLIEFVAPDGRSMVARTAALSVPGWRLVTEQPRREAYAAVRRALGAALWILALAVLAGSAVGIVLARRVVRPIRQLAEGADRIGDGRLDHRIELKREDELGQLAARFNQMAERLGDSYRLLEARVAERTQELLQANAMLSAKRQEAEQASQAKTRFLASASHDLRQPLHTVSLLVGVLRRQTTTAEVGKLIDHIQVSVSAMEGLFSSLLDISKLDAGMAKPVLADHGLAELLERLAANHGPQAARKQLRLVVVPSHCAVRTDIMLLERVLNNLVSNAIHYTEHGRILVGCRRRRDGIELQIRDTGIGIAPQHLPYLFDEFFQIDNPERDRTKGLGLGLSIVKRTLDLLGHSYELSSKPSRGTCFSIRLPLAEKEHMLQLSAPLAGPSASRDRPSITGAFIAVIDDEADTRRAMQALCHSWGAHIVAAASASQCLEQLSDHLRYPDLILCDYRLRQRQDGLDVVEQMRAHIGQEVPAIIITGDIAAADLRRVSDAGLPLLHKPVGADRLLAAIEAALQAEQATAPHPIGGRELAEMSSDSGHENPADR